MQLFERMPVLRRDGSLTHRRRRARVSSDRARLPDYVRRVHAGGRQVYVWTVNDPADIDLVLSLGVDGVITDRPTDVLARLARRR